MPKSPTWIIKLGGSLVGSTALQTWVDELRQRATGGRFVVVPGGGPFAESVRVTQAALGIDDRTAHRMAVLGMRQFALAITALAGGDVCAPLVTLEQLLAGEGEPGLCVWDPLDSALGASGLPEDWTATSDSIAVWLGSRVEARGTVLVKSRRPIIATADADVLAEECFIDTCVPRLLRAGASSVWWVERGAVSDFADLLAGERCPGNAISTTA